MSTFSVPIVKISKINPIFTPTGEQASSIELATVFGYQSVVQKGKYNVGDLAAYIPEGALLPSWLVTEMGLLGKLAGPFQNRVKAVKLLGNLSQGLLYPVEHNFGTHAHSYDLVMPDRIFKKIGPNQIIVNGKECVVPISEDLPDILNVDVAEQLGITKYEPEIPSSMNGEITALYGHTIHYDIENLQRHTDVLLEGEEVVITSKLHGCADYDTILETFEMGCIKIGDIVTKQLIGLHTKSFNIEENSIEFNKIEGVSELESNDDWYELEYDGKYLKLTGNHPVYLPRLKCYRRVSDLTGDELILVD